jgi:hypothetical protein
MLRWPQLRRRRRRTAEGGSEVDASELLRVMRPGFELETLFPFSSVSPIVPSLPLAIIAVLLLLSSRTSGMLYQLPSPTKRLETFLHKMTLGQNTWGAKHLDPSLPATHSATTHFGRNSTIIIDHLPTQFDGRHVRVSVLIDRILSEYPVKHGQNFVSSIDEGV